MQFEQFKRKMKSAEESASAQSAQAPDLVYYRFVQEMFEALRSFRYKGFSPRECVESLGILELRFGSFLNELDHHDCGGDAVAQLAARNLSEALTSMLDILAHLALLAETPHDERVDLLVEEFRRCNEVILGVNSEMNQLAAESRL